jgi:ribosome-associated protein
MSLTQRATLNPAAPKLRPSKTKGYWANGVWVKAQDALAEKAELPTSRTEDKQASHAAQELGLALVDLRAKAYAKLQTQGHVTERLAQVLEEYKRITNFEGKRRQAQLVGKLMRALPDESAAAIAQAIQAQASGSLEDAAAIHRVERWRGDLLADDAALPKLLAHLQAERPGVEADTQRIRALVRQARKDRAETLPEGATSKPSRAHKELFQMLKDLLQDE